jgi:hypothetical protein
MSVSDSHILMPHSALFGQRAAAKVVKIRHYESFFLLFSCFSVKKVVFLQEID